MAVSVGHAICRQNKLKKQRDDDIQIDNKTPSIFDTGDNWNSYSEYLSQLLYAYCTTECADDLCRRHYLERERMQCFVLDDRHRQQPKHTQIHMPTRRDNSKRFWAIFMCISFLRNASWALCFAFSTFISPIKWRWLVAILFSCQSNYQRCCLQMKLIAFAFCVVLFSRQLQDGGSFMVDNRRFEYIIQRKLDPTGRTGGATFSGESFTINTQCTQWCLDSNQRPKLTDAPTRRGRRSK